eukprot:scaffold3051_cov175-Amphora_coffeaeformis.AAC.12
MVSATHRARTHTRNDDNDDRWSGKLKINPQLYWALLCVEGLQATTHSVHSHELPVPYHTIPTLHSMCKKGSVQD